MRGSHYTVPLGTDLCGVVRKFYLDGGTTPAPGLLVEYTLRDAAGNELISGQLVDLPTALGWYRLPGTFEAQVAGTYTVEFYPPVGFAADADTLFVVAEIGRATSRFVQ